MEGVMVPNDELNEQIHHITELSNVLRHLLKDRAICDSKTCCNLFSNYMKTIENHIDAVDKQVYGDMLSSQDTHISNVARNFMAGSVMVKKILRDFSRLWCADKNHSAFKIHSYARFIEDTDKLFEIVLQRVLYETEHLYPLVRQLSMASPGQSATASPLH